MTELLDRIREFFRENPRMWGVVAAAVLVASFAIWVTFDDGSSVGVSEFRAAQVQNPALVINNQHTYAHGETLSISWSATNAASCTSRNGWFDTGGVNEGTATSVPVDACASSAGSVGVRCDYANGDFGIADLNFSIDTSTCPTTTGTPTPSSTPTGGEDCTLLNGLWYCQDLTCGLAGNGSNPPAGPATSIEVSQFRTVCDDVEVPNNPQVGCKIFMDATPKLGSQEGYPPRDPAWTCTGSAVIEETEGRYCYTPYAKATAPGPVTCCANTGLPGDCVSFTVQARSTTSGAPTAPPAAAVLKVTCSASSANLSWNIPARANTNAIQRMIPGGTWVNIYGDATLTKTSYVDAPLVAGAQWRHKSGANVASNVVSCSGTVPTPTPTTSVIQGPPVRCFPDVQSVGINEIARLQATGGTNVFTWNVTQGGSIEEGGNEYIGVSYRTVGLKTLRVNSGGTSAACRIDVLGDGEATPTPTFSITPTPTPLSGSTTVEKTAQNSTTGDPIERTAVTVYPGQSIQFVTRVKNISSSTINNVMVIDALPAGMSYQPGSTTINSQRSFDDAITTTGLAIGSILSGDIAVVTWVAVADRTSNIVSGPNQYAPSARVLIGGALDAQAYMSVTVYGTGGSSPVSEIPTGPGSAILIALLTAAALTLLYSGYTRSPTYRRREADDVSRDQGPLDFRS